MLEIEAKWVLQMYWLLVPFDICCLIEGSFVIDKVGYKTCSVDSE